MIIRECLTETEIMSTYIIMSQLRPHLIASEYVALINSLKETEKYRLIGLFDDHGICLAVAGFKVTRCLFGGGVPELYIDDLVTDERLRSSGFGHELFTWIKKESKQLGCRGVVLDSGLQRQDAHRFYYKEGMTSTALHFYRPKSPDLEQEDALSTSIVGASSLQTIPEPSVDSSSSSTISQGL